MNEKSYKQERVELLRKQKRRLIIREDLIKSVKKGLKEMEKELERDWKEFSESQRQRTDMNTIYTAKGCEKMEEYDKKVKEFKKWKQSKAVSVR